MFRSVSVRGKRKGKGREGGPLHSLCAWLSTCACACTCAYACTCDCVYACAGVEVLYMPLLVRACTCTCTRTVTRVSECAPDGRDCRRQGESLCCSSMRILHQGIHPVHPHALLVHRHKRVEPAHTV